MQLRTFTQWWNAYLAPRGFVVSNLREQIKDGVLLLRLIEALEGVPPSPVSRGKIKMTVGSPGLTLQARPQVQSQRVENINLCLQFLKAEPPHGRNLRLSHTRAAGLANDKDSDQLSLVLGLTWELIKLYELGGGGGGAGRGGGSGASSVVSSGSGSRELLLQWVRKATEGYSGVAIGAAHTAWVNDFRDGLLLAALVHAHAPWAIDYAAVAEMPPGAERLGVALRAAGRLGAPPLLDLRDVARGSIDALSMITYIGRLRTSSAPVRRTASPRRAAVEAEPPRREAEGGGQPLLLRSPSLAPSWTAC